MCQAYRNFNIGFKVQTNVWVDARELATVQKLKSVIRSSMPENMHSNFQQTQNRIEPVTFNAILVCWKCNDVNHLFIGTWVGNVILHVNTMIIGIVNRSKMKVNVSIAVIINPINIYLSRESPCKTWNMLTVEV